MASVIVACPHRIADGATPNIELHACKIRGNLSAQQVHRGRHVFRPQRQDAPGMHGVDMRAARELHGNQQHSKIQQTVGYDTYV